MLIVSLDAIGPALLGALVETLGYRVGFRRPGERLASAVRRWRAELVLLDASDPELSAEALGHAQMLEVPVIVFGTQDAVQRVRDTVADRSFAALVMPMRIESVQAALQNALADG